MVERGENGDIMPTFEVSKKDLENLVGRKFTIHELEEALLYAKTELDEYDGDTLKLDVKDTNRPDLWSVEGIARELRGNYRIEEGLPKYEIKKSGKKIIVESSEEFHPLATAAIVKGVNIDEKVLSQMIQLQEKVSGTFGRNRKSISMGAYDLSMIKFPLKYVGKKPEQIKFIPLGHNKKMTAKQILQQHEKGKQYGHLLKDVKKYNVWEDADKNIIAMEPITNSNDAGNVTTETKDVFLEVTGENMKVLHTAINVLAAALADRGGQIESVEIIYKNKKIITPNFTPKKAHLDPDYCRKILGLNISNKEIIKLLNESRCNARMDKKKIHVEYPPYRQDIMHQRDLVEDVAISFGYNNIKPEIPALPTIGSRDSLEDFTDTVRELCVGLGLQEVMTFTLTNKQNLFNKMNLPEEDLVEIENPVSNNWSVFRTSILPNLLEFLYLNKNQEYPQKIFEVGDVVLLDSSNKETGVNNKRKLAVTLTNTLIGYEDISSILESFLSNLDVKFSLKESKHKSFIPGRVASIIVRGKEIGIIGELHPKVLNNWNLEKAVVCFELDVEDLINEL